MGDALYTQRKSQAISLLKPMLSVSGGRIEDILKLIKQETGDLTLDQAKYLFKLLKSDFGIQIDESRISKT